jgi:hypothetical protein
MRKFLIILLPLFLFITHNEEKMFAQITFPLMKFKKALRNHFAQRRSNTNTLEQSTTDL